MGVEKCFPLVLLFLSSGVLSNAQKAAEAEAGAPPAETSVTAAAGAPLTVECWLRVEQRADWRLDGAAPPADLRAAAEGAPRGGWLLARLHAAAARPAHAGLYTCARGPDARRVRVHVPAAGPAEPEPATAAAVGAAATPALASAPDHYYEINRALILNCTNPDVDKDTYTWSKNDTEVSLVLDLVKRYELLEGDAVFKVKQALEEDYGNYTCVSGGGGWRAAWRVRGKPHARLPANTNVVEGQKLKLQCKVVGKPHPVVTWTYRNSSGPEGGSPLQEGGRLRLEAGEGGVPGATLVLEEAQRADAGEYTCVPGEVGVRATTTLRVKDMYAALWPFLGICAEVFVLCAIILVYEKRRTKPELDDSDTDNHDQKKS